MSRTWHPRRPSDERERRAPKSGNEKKRALYSFKRINGVTTSSDDGDRESASAE